MNRTVRHLASLFLLLAAGFSFSSCTEEDTATTNNQIPSNLTVQQISATRVKIKWTRGTEDLGADTVIITPVLANATDIIKILPSPTDSLDFDSVQVVNAGFKVRVASVGGSVSADYSPLLATNMGVQAVDDKSVAIRWSRRTADVGVDSVVAWAGTTRVASATAASPISMVTITGLTLGTEYTFRLHTGNSTQDVKYAPAVRSSVIRLWETSDNTSGHPSGLVFGSPAQPKSAEAVSVGASSADRLRADLVLATDNSNNEVPNLTFSAPDVTTLSGIDNGRSTRMSGAYAIVGGLDSLYFSSGDVVVAAVTPTGNSWELRPSQVPSGSSAVLLLKTADGNYARVEVIPQANGLQWGDDATSNKRFVDVRVSYQPTIGWGYVGRPQMVTMGANAPVRKIGTIQR